MKIAIIAWGTFAEGFIAGAGWAAVQLTAEHGAEPYHGRSDPT